MCEVPFKRFVLLVTGLNAPKSTIIIICLSLSNY